MVLTKGNVAAHAVAEHLVSLQMPDHLREDGTPGSVLRAEPQRLVTHCWTSSLPIGNQVIRQKSLLIGCEVASNKNAARNVALPTKAIFPPCCCFFSGHRGCLSDITRALFCSLGTTCGWLTVSPLFAFVCCFNWPFRTFLS